MQLYVVTTSMFDSNNLTTSNKRRHPSFLTCKTTKKIVIFKFYSSKCSDSLGFNLQKQRVTLKCTIHISIHLAKDERYSGELMTVRFQPDESGPSPNTKSDSTLTKSYLVTPNTLQIYIRSSSGPKTSLSYVVYQIYILRKNFKLFSSRKQ